MKDSDLTESDEKFVSELKEKLKNKNYEFKAENTTKNVDWKSKRLIRKLTFLINFFKFSFYVLDPDEVKDYLDNLEIEYSFQCVSQKLPDGCHRLANFLELIRGKYKDATEIYKKNCDDYKYSRSCLTYAKNATLGRGWFRFGVYPMIFFIFFLT